jgi:hypothetical protein
METVWGEFWVQTYETVSMGIKVETPERQQPMDHLYEE